MNYFSIKDIERLSGIKAHTLRIWEQRHGLSFCKRKESLHRYYDNEDLKDILRIAFLYHNGFKVSKIATLSKEEILELSEGNQSETRQDVYVNHMIESSIDFDQPRFEKILHTALMHLGFEKAVLNVFYPFMEKIGLLWITHHIIPAQEHFSSYLIQKKILLAIDGLETPSPASETKVLIYSPKGELHEIPLLITRYMLKKNGISTVYFGTQISEAEILYYCTHRNVTHLYFHFITNFLNKESFEYLDYLVEKFPDKKIIASGPALQGVRHSSPNVIIVSSLEDFFQIHTKVKPAAEE